MTKVRLPTVIVGGRQKKKQSTKAYKKPCSLLHKAHFKKANKIIKSSTGNLNIYSLLEKSVTWVKYIPKPAQTLLKLLSVHLCHSSSSIQIAA